MHASTITRSDVKAAFISITAPQVANQTLAALSAMFNWAVREEIVKTNPCALVERNETRSRERVLADSEIPEFWTAFDNAGLFGGTLLKMILLTGQRPGEVAHMHLDHIIDGWWEMPGEPAPALNWPGTKNGHSHRAIHWPAWLDHHANGEGYSFALPFAAFFGASVLICSGSQFTTGAGKLRKSSTKDFCLSGETIQILPPNPS